MWSIRRSASRFHPSLVKSTANATWLWPAEPETASGRLNDCHPNAISVPHEAKRVEKARAKNWIDSFEHDSLCRRIDLCFAHLLGMTLGSRFIVRKQAQIYAATSKMFLMRKSDPP